MKSLTLSLPIDGETGERRLSKWHIQDLKPRSSGCQHATLPAALTITNRSLSLQSPAVSCLNEWGICGHKQGNKPQASF